MATPLPSYVTSFEENDQVHLLIEPSLRHFYRFLRYQLFFYCSFTFLFFSELVLFFVFFSNLFLSSLLAFAIGVFFFTLFSFVTLRLYFQSRKWAQLQEIRDTFLTRCRKWLNYDMQSADHQIALANLCTKFSNQLERGEYFYFRPPPFLSALLPSLQRFFAWWFGMDYHVLREMLLQQAVQEHISVVKKQPTNLEAHANLANAYVILSSLYSFALTTEEDGEWTPSVSVQAQWEKKFRATAEKAVEELKILNDYAPNDPWVHAQLAYSYHDLQMPFEEIREYEIVYRLRPEDKQTLFRLGVLYFEQGFNAKGLRVYEELRRSDPKKAEALIKYYGACEGEQTSFIPKKLQRLGI